eukprot:g3605.t1
MNIDEILQNLHFDASSKSAFIRRFRQSRGLNPEFDQNTIVNEILQESNSQLQNIALSILTALCREHSIVFQDEERKLILQLFSRKLEHENSPLRDDFFDLIRCIVVSDSQVLWVELVEWIYCFQNNSFADTAVLVSKLKLLSIVLTERKYCELIDDTKIRAIIDVIRHIFGLQIDSQITESVLANQCPAHCGTELKVHAFNVLGLLYSKFNISLVLMDMKDSKELFSSCCKEMLMNLEICVQGSLLEYVNMILASLVQIAQENPQVFSQNIADTVRIISGIGRSDDLNDDIRYTAQDILIGLLNACNYSDNYSLRDKICGAILLIYFSLSVSLSYSNHGFFAVDSCNFGNRAVSRMSESEVNKTYLASIVLRFISRFKEHQKWQARFAACQSLGELTHILVEKDLLKIWPIIERFATDPHDFVRIANAMILRTISFKDGIYVHKENDKSFAAEPRVFPKIWNILITSLLCDECPRVRHESMEIVIIILEHLAEERALDILGKSPLLLTFETDFLAKLDSAPELSDSILQFIDLIVTYLKQWNNKKFAYVFIENFLQIWMESLKTISIIVLPEDQRTEEEEKENHDDAEDDERWQTTSSIRLHALKTMCELVDLSFGDPKNKLNAKQNLVEIVDLLVDIEQQGFDDIGIRPNTHEYIAVWESLIKAMGAHFDEYIPLCMKTFVRILLEPLEASQIEELCQDKLEVLEIVHDLLRLYPEPMFHFLDDLAQASCQLLNVNIIDNESVYDVKRMLGITFLPALLESGQLVQAACCEATTMDQMQTGIIRKYVGELNDFLTNEILLSLDHALVPNLKILPIFLKALSTCCDCKSVGTLSQNQSKILKTISAIESTCAPSLQMSSELPEFAFKQDIYTSIGAVFDSLIIHIEMRCKQWFIRLFQRTKESEKFRREFLCIYILPRIFTGPPTAKDEKLLLESALSVLSSSFSLPHSSTISSKFPLSYQNELERTSKYITSLLDEEE